MSMLERSDRDSRLALTNSSDGEGTARSDGRIVVVSPQEERRDFDPVIQIDIVQIGRTLLQHRWTILAAIVTAMAVGAVITFLMQPIYTAQSTLQIDRDAAKVFNTQDVTPSEEQASGEEFYQTQYGLLRSRSLAVKVEDTLGLAANDSFLRTMGAAPIATGRDAAAAQAARRDAVLELLRKNLGVNPVRGSRLVVVTFASPSPTLSSKVANAFAENFIAANLERRFESSSYAREFLENRIAQVKAKLEESERELVAYAEKQQIIQLNGPAQAASGPTTERSLTAENLESLNAALSTAKAQRIQAEQRWRQSQTTTGYGLPEMLQSSTMQQLTQARARLSAEYEQKARIYQPDYPEMQQLKAQLDETDRQLGLEAQNIRSSLQAQYAVALANERALEGQVRGLKGDVMDLRVRSIEYNILQREVDTNRTLYDGLLQRYKEVGVAGGVTTNNISIVDRSVPPRLPSSPNIVLNLAVAAVAGLGLGIILAFLIEFLDQAVRAPRDVESKLGKPLLGLIPMLERGVQPGPALEDTRSPISEAYHSLRSALQFSTKDGFPRTLLVTSARPSEGKSTTALAMAHNLARLGYRTLIVDADLRDPSLHKMVGAENHAGLSNILTGSAQLADVVQEGNAPNLFVVTCGPLPPNPAELLASTRLQVFTQNAAAKFDMVIFDGPPVMGLADAPMIAAVMKGVLFVIEAGRTGRAQARAALHRLSMVNAHTLGVVLTKFDPRRSTEGYGYGHQYDYDYDYGRTPSKIVGRQSALRSIGGHARRLIKR